MALSCYKQEGEGFHSNPSQSNKFFKILLNPQDNGLEIPTYFMRKWGHNMPDKVTLKAPNGSERQVKVVRSNAGKTFLHQEWHDFKDYYSIGFGYMLVFVYDGNSHFDVLIFDMTTSEIEYPVANAQGRVNIRADSQKPESDEYESESDDSPVILKDFREELKGKGKCGEVKGQKLSKCKEIVKTVDRETCIAYQKAQAFASVNPFFVSLMQPSYICRPVVLNIPVTFAREHLSRKRNKLTFQVPGGKTWTVWCILGLKANLTTGWKKFVKENALKVGNACVFEVNKGEKLLWDVTIFRN